MDTNDLPAISALRDEESPPPVETTTFARFRIKLPKRSQHDDPSQSSSSLHNATATHTFHSRADLESNISTRGEEDELEEDQLIDDDDLGPSVPREQTVQPPAPQSRRASPKKGRGRKNQMKSQEPQFMVSTFELAPNDNQQARTTEESWTPVQTYVPPTLHTPSRGGRRKSSGKKEKDISGPSRSRKSKMPKVVVQPQMQDDAGSISEAVVATAPSSPIPFEPEKLDLDHVPNLSTLSLPIIRDPIIDPEFEPVPVWPLPTKNFSVQPAPKIPTGHAPAQPLDKTLAKVRSWRIAHREMRGIGGGRWFVRTWVGEKESEYSAATIKLGPAASGVLPAPSRKLKFLKPETGSGLVSGTSTPTPVPADVYIAPQLT